MHDRAGNSIVTNRQNRVTEFHAANVGGRFAPGGQATFIQASHNGVTTTVTRDPHGASMIETRQPGGVRVVSYSAHSGYVEKPLPGHPNLVSRTVVNGSVTQVSVYRTYTYNQQSYYRYVPAVYYHPAFYAWINTPWVSPVIYPWGTPVWGAYYGAYFTPYQAYLTADLWLTDYTLNANLQRAYAERQNTTADPTYSGATSPDDQTGISQPNPGTAPIPNPASTSQPQLSPDVKTLLSRQVNSYVSSLQTVSMTVPAKDLTDAPPMPANTMPESLKPDVTAFQISTDMQLELADNQTCALTPGDVLFRTTSTPDANNKLQVVVVGSKPGDCDMSTTASVPVATLEEINNSFNQQLDQGIAVLAKQGKGPFPPAPKSTTTGLQLASLQPDPDADAALQQNQASGQQAQAELAAATNH